MKRVAAAFITGILAGLAVFIFLLALNWATSTREHFPKIIFLLPLAGFYIAWVYQRFGRDAIRGNQLIFETIHNPNKTLPLGMAPLILFSTIITHLFGGSAGREGTAVQMAATLADTVAKWFKLIANERKLLLCAGLSAGFGAALGTPLAGALFGMEVLYVGKFKVHAWLECLIASGTAFAICKLLHAPHTVFPHLNPLHYSAKLFAVVILLGIAAGLIAWLFSKTTHEFEKIISRVSQSGPLKALFGGILLIALYHLEGSYQYVGLGIDSIQAAFSSPADFQMPWLKLFFTALTLAAGFKGGEFIPLVFIGVTFASFISGLTGIDPSILAAIGFGAVFAGASNTPLTCTIMAMELFGYQIGLLALLACALSYFCSGNTGIYAKQHSSHGKYKIINKFF